MEKLALVILAAGEAKRMGSPKQLLLYKGMRFIERALKIGKEAFGERICIVLGAGATVIKDAVPRLGDYIMINNNWQHGMGTSIAFGLQGILDRYPDSKAVMFMAVDQPFVSGAHLKNMVSSYQRGEKKIIVSTYKDSEGIPALFDEQYFDLLLQLNTDKGAKDIIRGHQQDVTGVHLEGGEIDIDTPEQYKAINDQVPDNKISSPD